MGHYCCEMVLIKIANYVGVQVGSEYRLLFEASKGLWMHSDNNKFKARKFTTEWME